MDHNKYLREPLLDNSFGHNEEESNIADAGNRDLKRLSNSDKSIHTKAVIFLELLTARVLLAIIFLTYFFFVLCQLGDYNQIISGFQEKGNFQLSANACSANVQSQPLISSASGGCMISNNTWVGQVVELQNVISVQLEASFNNITSSGNETDSLVVVPYSVSLFACYESEGCGNKFESQPNNELYKWHQVFSLGDSGTPLLAYLDTNGFVNELGENGATISIFNITFQNQEAVPTKGIIQSYYTKVEYQLTPQVTNILNPTNPYEDIHYTLNIVNRPSAFLDTIFCILVMCITVLISVAFVYIVHKEQGTKWLPEQWWLVVYFVAVFMFQNPFYISISFTENPSPGLAFTSYIFDRFSQSIFLVIWLMFSDCYSLQNNGSTFQFYFWKIMFGIAFFGSSVAILVYQFPDLISNTEAKSRSPVQAVVSWPADTQKEFIAICLVYSSLFWIWCIWWITNLYKTDNNLRKLSYMKTRYLQLSFRLFFIQATLVFIYYVLQYGTIVFYIWKTQASVQTLDTLTDELNTIFRQQTHLFGKVLFLSVYAALLAFCFLPASFLQDQKTSMLASAFVIYKGEKTNVQRMRKKQMKHLGVGLLNDLMTNAKSQVFCVELAMEMVEIAYEAYYDTVKCRTESGSSSEARQTNRENSDFAMIDMIYDPSFETFCLIARHKSNALYVSFRGTTSSVHWKANLDYEKKNIGDIKDLILHDVDLEDGLEIQDSAYLKLNLYDDDNDDDDDDDGDENYSVGFENGDENFGIGKRGMSFRETFLDGAERSAQVIGNATSTVLNLSSGIAKYAAKQTPLINNLVEVQVHTGFWEAYNCVREKLHRIIRKELKNRPGEVFVTGHSLGGALATFAAVDLATHTVSRINRYHNYKYAKKSNHSALQRPTKTTLAMYTFGAPKVGNGPFVNEYNKMVPDAFRVKVDGDIVPNLPPLYFNYAHVGTEVVIDGSGYGSIIIDQSFVESWLRPRNHGINPHLMEQYIAGINGIKEASVKHDIVEAKLQINEQWKGEEDIMNELNSIDCEVNDDDDDNENKEESSMLSAAFLSLFANSEQNRKMQQKTMSKMLDEGRTLSDRKSAVQNM